MTIFENDAHPRISDGTFTDKVQSPPQVGLWPSIVFGPGDELPDFGPGATIEADGELAFKVATSENPFQPRYQWITASGRHVTLVESTISIQDAPEIDAEGFQERRAGSLRHGDQIWSRDPAEYVGDVQIVVNDGERQGHVRVATLGEHQGLVYVPADEMFRVKPESPDRYRYDPAGNMWENIQATKSSETDADELAAIIGLESEDNYMTAAIANPNVTPELVDRVSRHHNIRVRRAVVFSPKASAETLRRVMAASARIAASSRADLAKSAGKPASSHLRVHAEQNESLARAAAQMLARRWA